MQGTCGWGCLISHLWLEFIYRTFLNSTYYIYNLSTGFLNKVQYFHLVSIVRNCKSTTTVIHTFINVGSVNFLKKKITFY